MWRFANWRNTTTWDKSSLQSPGTSWSWWVSSGASTSTGILTRGNTIDNSSSVAQPKPQLNKHNKFIFWTLNPVYTQSGYYKFSLCADWWILIHRRGMVGGGQIVQKLDMYRSKYSKNTTIYVILFQPSSLQSNRRTCWESEPQDKLQDWTSRVRHTIDCIFLCTMY